MEITYKDRKHRSMEHAFHHCRADDNDQPDLAEQIRKAKTSREAMSIGKRIKTSEEYKTGEPVLLQDIHLAKNQQHPNLRAKLTNLKGNLYEATHHPIYGAGFSLAQRRHINKCEKYKNNVLHNGAVKWNALPVKIRNIGSYNSFKTFQKKNMLMY